MRDKKYCRQSEKSQYMWLNMYLDIDRFLPHRSITTSFPHLQGPLGGQVFISQVSLSWTLCYHFTSWILLHLLTFHPLPFSITDACDEKASCQSEISGESLGP